MMEIEDRDWQLMSFANPAGKSQTPAGEITLRLERDGGRVAGSAGCNSYAGSYTLEEDAVSFSPLAMSKRMCASRAVMNQEQRFANWLGQAERFSMQNDELVLETPRGHTLRFAPVD
jgi:heat shock protein HslJ